MTQKSSGTGNSFSVEYGYRFFENFVLSLSVNRKTFNAESSGTMTFFNNNQTTDKVKLNEVNWDSTSGMIGLRYNF